LLEPSRLEAGHDAADRPDLLEQRLRLALELIGERLGVQPPNGSMTFGTPVSYASTCWVRSDLHRFGRQRASRPSSWCAATAFRRERPRSLVRVREQCCSRLLRRERHPAVCE
jgi:hypothetical protein